MYSAQSTKRLNYYVEIQDVETPPLEKCTSILPTRRAARLLGRRYALTATGFKYLEIDINVGPPSYMEIAIGDHRGKELLLSLEAWKGLYEERLNIQTFLESMQGCSKFNQRWTINNAICYA